MKSWRLLLPLAFLAGTVHAEIPNCATVPRAMPQDSSVLAPVAAGLAPATSVLGSNVSGVLGMGYDQSQSVDQVLLRMRIEKCKDVAKALPAVPGVNPNDPATYKPQTQWDNTPWRFNMTQNGKRMTADEFSAWMTAKGVRVAKGRAPTPAPAAVDPSQPGTVPAPQAAPATPASAGAPTTGVAPTPTPAPTQP